MSRIGKLPVILPDTVSLDYNATEVNVKGPKGNLKLELRPEITLKKEENKIIVDKKDNSKKSRAMHGLYRVLINNMVTGVTQGFEKRLEVIGTGYRCQVQGNKLILNIGYSYPYEYEIPEGLTITVDNNTIIIIQGIDKQLVGHAASIIRKMRPPEPYKGKGIKYTDEIIKRKAGKSN